MSLLKTMLLLRERRRSSAYYERGDRIPSTQSLKAESNPPYRSILQLHSFPKSQKVLLPKFVLSHLDATKTLPNYVHLFPNNLPNAQEYFCGYLSPTTFGIILDTATLPDRVFLAVVYLGSPTRRISIAPLKRKIAAWSFGGKFSSNR
jgi:hypothetical protein